MGRRRVARKGAALTVAMFLAVLATVSLGSAAGARTAPTLSLSSATVAPGQSVGLSGEHWPPHLILQASICGGLALQGHEDCDLGRSITFGPADNGVVQTSMSVGIPPAPCPCVVLVTSTDPTSAVEMTVPIDIQGAPTATPRPAPPPYRPTVMVVDAHVVSVSSWTSWFGTAAAKELIVAVRNIGHGPIRPLLAARWIDSKTSHVIQAPPSKTIRAGRTVTLAAPFSLSTLTWGHEELTGEVQGTTFDVAFSTGTSTYPWGLLLLAALISLATVALLVRSVIRQRRHEHPRPTEGDVASKGKPSGALSETGVAQ